MNVGEFVVLKELVVNEFLMMWIYCYLCFCGWCCLIVLLMEYLLSFLFIILYWYYELYFWIFYCVKWIL